MTASRMQRPRALVLPATVLVVTESLVAVALYKLVATMLVNLLDGLCARLASAAAVWHRRHWYADLIRTRAREAQEHSTTVRIIDIACGGSRYLRDVLAEPGLLNVLDMTFLDQDPAAIAYVNQWLPDKAVARTVCAPVKRLPALEIAESASYDIVISTGLFDYLPAEPAQELLSVMDAIGKPETGLLAICNFASEDPSRTEKEWIADWPLLYRTATEFSDLFAMIGPPTIFRSPDQGLLYGISVPGTKGRA